MLSKITFGSMFVFACMASSCASRAPALPWSTAQEVADSVLACAQRQDSKGLVSLQLPRSLWESHIWPHEELARQTNSDTSHARMVRDFAWQMLQANSNKGLRRLQLGVAEEIGVDARVSVDSDTTWMGSVPILPSPVWNGRVLGGSLVRVANRWWMLSYSNGGSKQQTSDNHETQLEREKP